MPSLDARRSSAGAPPEQPVTDPAARSRAIVTIREQIPAEAHRFRREAEVARRQAEETLRRAERLDTEADRLAASLPAAERGLVLAYLGSVGHALAAHLTVREEARRRLRDPSPPEQQILEVRSRLAANGIDPITRQAYTLLLDTLRANHSSFAQAVDQWEAVRSATVRLPVFVRPDSLTLAVPAPVPLASVVHVAMVCASWEASAHLGGPRPVEAGAVGPLHGVRVGGDFTDPDLLALLGEALSEAWGRRAALEGLSPSLERAPDDAPVPWDPRPTAIDLPADLLRDHPRWVASLAAALEVPLFDILAVCHRNGIPLLEDETPEGVDPSTLRALLRPAQAPAQAAPPPPAPAQAPLPAAPAPLTPAQRVLDKMVRYRYIGGAHTDANNIVGRGFADHETDASEGALHWYIREGIVLTKAKGPSTHVSVDPRRMDDVRAILAGTHPRLAEIG